VKKLGFKPKTIVLYIVSFSKEAKYTNLLVFFFSKLPIYNLEYLSINRWEQVICIWDKSLIHVCCEYLHANSLMWFVFIDRWINIFKLWKIREYTLYNLIYFETCVVNFLKVSKKIKNIKNNLFNTIFLFLTSILKILYIILVSTSLDKLLLIFQSS
jgi:hypothetical protein